jgi:transcriptional regulator with XRE-family HTH domain
MLKTLRGAKGWTQKQLADMSGVSQTYISELEAAKFQPTVAVALKLAQALGVELIDLLRAKPVPDNDTNSENHLRDMRAADR